LRDDGLALSPQLSECWRSLAFYVHWRGRRFRISITQGGLAVSATMDQGEPMTLHVHGTPHELRRDKAAEVGA